MNVDLRTLLENFIHFENYTLRKMSLLLKHVLFWHLGIQDHISLNSKYAISSYNLLQVTQG